MIIIPKDTKEFVYFKSILRYNMKNLLKIQRMKNQSYQNEWMIKISVLFNMKMTVALCSYVI